MIGRFVVGAPWRNTPGSDSPRQKTINKEPRRYIKGWEKGGVWKMDTGNMKLTYREDLEARERRISRANSCTHEINLTSSIVTHSPCMNCSYEENIYSYVVAFSFCMIRQLLVFL